MNEEVSSRLSLPVVAWSQLQGFNGTAWDIVHVISVQPDTLSSVTSGAHMEKGLEFFEKETTAMKRTFAAVSCSMAGGGGHS